MPIFMSSPTADFDSAKRCDLEQRTQARPWAARFEQERRSLEPGLSAWLTTPIQHVGPTAVPGLAAKPIIDMIAGVSDPRKARGAIQPRADFGYIHAERGSPLWTERLAFRDALRANSDLAERYGCLKIDLAARHPDDLRAYTDGKRAYVAQVLANVGVTLQPR